MVYKTIALPTELHRHKTNHFNNGEILPKYIPIVKQQCIIYNAECIINGRTAEDWMIGGLEDWKIRRLATTKILQNEI